MVIGKPSTDLPQVWTLVPEVPTLASRLKLTPCWLVLWTQQ
jgi:hypothetical protein